MCAHKENCGFMRTYILCCIRCEEKVYSEKKGSKTRLNKRSTHLFGMLFTISFISIFTVQYPVPQTLRYIIKEVDTSENFNASSLLTIEEAILDQQRN